MYELLTDAHAFTRCEYRTYSLCHSVFSNTNELTYTDTHAHILTHVQKAYISPLLVGCLGDRVNHTENRISALTLKNI